MEMRARRCILRTARCARAPAPQLVRPGACLRNVPGPLRNVSLLWRRQDVPLSAGHTNVSGDLAM
jgi:hypothetical protein